jgi:NTP pyrophosphatase (non-canonical NTP hydrolase)
MQTIKFDELRLKVLDWAAERSILQHGSAIAQLTKTEEEVAELREAIENNDIDKAVDGYGDVLVTLIIGSEIMGLDLVDCLEAAYEEIKDRKGYLNEDGIFVKEQ